MAETAGLFETSLDDLMQGNAETGIMEPTSWEILGELELIRAEWLKIRPFLTSASKGRALSRSDLEALPGTSDQVLSGVNDTVGLYESF